MIILPDYSKKPKCYYCGKNTALKKHEKSHTYYRVVGGTFGLGYKYFRCKVGIPRCTTCEEFVGKSTRWWERVVIIVLTLIPIVWLELYFDGFWNFVIRLIGGGIIGLIASSIFGYIVDAPKLKRAGIRGDSDIDDYPPIQLLHKYGFVDYKPDASHFGAAAQMEVEKDWDSKKDAFYSELFKMKDEGYDVNLYVDN